MTPEGGIDDRFNPRLTSATGGSDVAVHTLAVQPDGKIVIGGEFSQVNGQARTNLARLQSDGTLDPGFLSSDPGMAVTALALQPDGKILAGGLPRDSRGPPGRVLARFNSDGTPDTGFTPEFRYLNLLGQLWSLAVQPDGKIVAGGVFLEVNGQQRTYIVRLNADGSLDSAFDISVAGPSDNTHIDALALQPDGKILLGGVFTHVEQQPRTSLARLAETQPSQLALLPAPGGPARLRFTGAIGRSYTVQGANSLTAPIPWQNLGTGAVAADGKFEFGDAGAASLAYRFYRVISP